MKLNSSNQNPSVAARALSAVSCPLSANLAPTEQEVALLTTQYRKAVNGLYEAYRFGQMLAQVKARLEQFSGDAARDTASEVQVQGELAESPENQGSLGDAARGTAWNVTPGWNAGTGLKAWLAEHCPEINYSTARRFLSIAEKTNAALAAQALADSGQRTADSRSRDGESDGTQETDLHGSDGLSTSSASTVGDDIAPRYARTCQLSTVDCEPSEQAVRDFLEGKSQRAVLRLGGKREGAGRKPKDWAAALGTSPEVAMKRLEEALVPLNELIVVKALHRLLAPADLETVRGAIDLLRERIWENA